MTRYLIYHSAAARQYLCVCAARDKRHARATAQALVSWVNGEKT